MKCENNFIYMCPVAVALIFWCTIFIHVGATRSCMLYLVLKSYFSLVFSFSLGVNLVWYQSINSDGYQGQQHQHWSNSIRKQVLSIIYFPTTFMNKGCLLQSTTQFSKNHGQNMALLYYVLIVSESKSEASISKPFHRLLKTKHKAATWRVQNVGANEPLPRKIWVISFKNQEELPIFFFFFFF